MTETLVHDVLISGGVVVSEHSAVAANIYISDGRIAALVDPAKALLPASRTLDASGLHILPGIIDAHTHFRTLTKHSDTFADLARSAAHGGVTTVLAHIMGMNASDMRPAERAAVFVEEAARGAAVDYGFHLAINDEPGTLQDIPELVKMGISSFKMFMAYRARGMQIDDGAMLSAMETITGAGGTVMIHAEAGDLADKLEADRSGEQAIRALAESRPPWIEAEATRRALVIAEKASTVPYFVHVSCMDALSEIMQARGRGQQVIAESCPQYLNLSVDDFERLGGLAKIAPPLRSAGEPEAMVAAALAGHIQVIGSDHAPYTVADKQLDDIWAVPMGAPGTETLITTTWRAIQRAGGNVCHLARLLSAQPARTFGLYPDKGVIAVGSQADLTLVDLSAETVIDGSKQHNTSGYSPYDGFRSPLQVHSSFLEGRPLLQDGVLVNEVAGSFLVRTPASPVSETRS